MSCDRRCFETDWVYGEIDCGDCPGQDNYISPEHKKTLQSNLDEKLRNEILITPLRL